MRAFAAGLVAFLVAFLTVGVKPAEATVPWVLTIAGPSTGVVATPYAFTGRLSIASLAGVPNQTINLEVDGSPAGSTTTAKNGTFTKSLTFTASPTTHHVRAIAFKGTALETRSPLIPITVTVPSYTLTVTVNGAGSGVVTSSPAGINCAASTCSASFPASTVVALSAAPGSVSTFVGWSANCSGSGACNVTMSSAKSVTASFGLATHSLEVKINGEGNGFGTVTSSPAGVNCTGQCIQAVPVTTTFALTATPNAGSIFVGWGDACSGTGSCSVTMNADRRVTASFISKYALTVTFAGNGANFNAHVTSSPAGIDCSSSCPADFPINAVVTLTATAGVGRTFTGWSGGGCSGTGTCVVTMDAAKSVTATFTLLTYTLTITTNGPGTGIVTTSPAGISCPTTCTMTFNYGTNVAINAAPALGSAFGPSPAGWSGSGCFGQTPVGGCGVVMDADKTVNANFGLAPPP